MMEGQSGEPPTTHRRRSSHHHHHHHSGSRRHSHRRGPSRRLKVVAGALVVVLVVLLVVGGIGGVVTYGSAQSLERQVGADFGAGKQDLEAGKSLLEKATSARSPADLQAADAKFTAAQVNFTKASQRMSGSTLVRRGKDLPILGAYLSPRVSAVVQLSAAGSALTVAAQAVARIDGRLISPPAGASAPAQLVTALQQSTPDLDVIQAQLGHAQADLKRVQPGVLPSGDKATLQQLRTVVGGGVNGVTELRTLLPVLLQVLGMNGSQTYVIEQVNPAELRAGGGFIGSFSVMQATQGNFSLQQSQDTEVTDDEPRLLRGQSGYVTPPGPIQQFTGPQSWIFGDSNYYPSFVENGQSGLSLLQHETGIQAQGVISIDPNAVADLLKVIGPQAVPDWGVTINASNFASYIFQFENSSSHPVGRKSFFGDAAGPIIDALSKLPASRWPSLVSELNDAATHRDLQAYFTNPTVEDEMTRVGWSGVVNPDKAPDFLLESESNFGGTKANHFVRRTYHLDLTASGGELHHKVTVDIKDSEPSGYEGEGRDYTAYVRFYVPAGATGVSIGGVSADTVATNEQPPSGLQMKDGWAYIKLASSQPDGTAQVTFVYDTPYTGGSHQIYWQKQPGTNSDAIDVSWTTGGQTYTATSTLSQDKVVKLTSGGVTVTNGHAATAQLPSLGF